jgi:hypothetical protein
LRIMLLVMLFNQNRVLGSQDFLIAKRVIRKSSSNNMNVKDCTDTMILIICG